MRSTNKQRLGKTFINDVKQGGFFRTLKREWKEIRNFYIDEESSKRLSDMGRLRRWFYFTFWLMKSLFLKLTPVRRLLLLFSLIFLFQYNQSNTLSGNLLFSVFILLFILMLELKDKLLAKEELEVGRAVQSALMPGAIPFISGWDIWMYSRPAREVGGDMVDYIPIDEKRRAFVLADIAGKGLGAALFMTRLQAVLHALIPDYSQPAGLLEKLNTLFHRDRTPNRFASLFYLEIKPDTAELVYVNAGHLPPLVIQNRRLKELEKGQPALGLMDKTKYIEKTIHIKKEDIFLVYSDGLSEAMSENREFFGEKRIKAIVEKAADQSAQDIGKQLIRAIKNFTKDSPLSDDLSLLIIKNCGSGHSL